MVNVDSRNLIWEKGKAMIVVLAGGMYNITVGISSRGNSGGEVRVNGERIFVIGNELRYGIPERGRSPRLPVVSVAKLDEFVMLPPKAQISVINRAEGVLDAFLIIRKC